MVAITGEAAPGIPGTAFLQFGTPVINRTGQVAFRSTVTGTGITSTNNAGLWLTTSPQTTVNVARSGGDAWGSPGYIVEDVPTIPSAFADDGRLIFYALTYSFSANRSGNGIYSTSPDGVQPLIHFGDPHPAPVPGTWAVLTTGLNRAGRVVANDFRDGIWSGTSAASLSPVLISPGPVPGLGGGTTFDEAYWNRGLLNDSGAILTTAGIRIGNTYANNAVFAGTSAASVTKIAYQGDRVPSLGAGYTLSRVGPDYELNRAGSVVFNAEVNTPAGLANGLWLTNVSGAPLTKIALSTEPAPGSPAGVTYATLDNPRIAGNGTVFFTAALDGLPSRNNDQGVMRYTADGDVRLVVNNASAIPGTAPGVTASDFRNLLTNDAGQLTFSGVIHTPGGATPVNAILGYDPSSGVAVLAKVGDTVRLGPGDERTLSAIAVATSGANGQDGYATQLNDDGVFAYHATFSDHSEAILTTRVPIAGDTNADGVVDNQDLRTLFSHLETTGTRAEGDFNGDGRVDFRDFQLLELSFGRRPPGAPDAHLDYAELAADARSVPEPSVPGILLVAAQAIGRRRRHTPNRRHLALKCSN